MSALHVARSWVVERQELECVEVADVHCVDKRLMQVEVGDVECMVMLDAHFIAERLVQIDDGGCVDVEEVDHMPILNLDVQCRMRKAKVMQMRLKV